MFPVAYPKTNVRLVRYGLYFLSVEKQQCTLLLPQKGKYSKTISLFSILFDIYLENKLKTKYITQIFDLPDKHKWHLQATNQFIACFSSIIVYLFLLNNFWMHSLKKQKSMHKFCNKNDLLETYLFLFCFVLFFFFWLKSHKLILNCKWYILLGLLLDLGFKKESLFKFLFLQWFLTCLMSHVTINFSIYDKALN